MLIVKLIDGTEVAVDTPVTRSGFRDALVTLHPQKLMASGKLKDGTAVDFNVTYVVTAMERTAW